MVLRGGRDLLTGSPDVLDGAVKVRQLRCDGPLVHCTNRKISAQLPRPYKTRSVMIGKQLPGNVQSDF